MKIRWAILAFAVAFLLQTTIFGQFPICGISANLIMCLAVMTTFVFEHDYAGLVVGTATALLYDICFGQVMGLTALAIVAIVLLNMFVKTYFLNHENLLSGFIVAVTSPIIYYHFYWILVRIAGFHTQYLYMLAKMPLYILLNGVIMMIMFFIMTMITDKHRADRYTRWAR